MPVYEFDSKLGYPLGPGEKPSFNNDLLPPGNRFEALASCRYAFAYTFLALGPRGRARGLGESMHGRALRRQFRSFEMLLSLVLRDLRVI